MGSPLDDPALLQNHDTVGVPHRGETVGDDKGSAALHQPVHALLHQLLCASVDGGRGLVQNQDGRIGYGGAGDGEELPLALAQIGPIAGEDRLVAIRKPPDTPRFR